MSVESIAIDMTLDYFCAVKIGHFSGWASAAGHLNKLNDLGVIMLELGQHAEAAQLLKVSLCCQY